MKQILFNSTVKMKNDTNKKWKMKTENLFKIYGLLIWILFVQGIDAQVTIGSSIKPQPGALLDLKQNDNKGDNSTKGLLLPRVYLTSLKQLYPMFKDELEYNDPTAAKKSLEDRLHTSLMVYNINECLVASGKGSGTYVWTGEKWLRLDKEKKEKTKSSININSDQNLNIFHSSTFGLAGEWMLQNLHVDKYSDGTAIGNASTSTSTTDKTRRWTHPTINEGDQTNGNIYNGQRNLGYLYNWYAALNAETTTGVDEGQGTANERLTGIGGICPQGWYVPSDVEWNTLEDHISSHPADYSLLTSAIPITPNDVGARGTHSKAMRSLCLPVELAEKSDGLSFSMLQGGFSILLAGTNSLGNSIGFGEQTAYWTASSKDSNEAWQRVFSLNDDAVQRSSRAAHEMLSIRCKKSESFNTCGDLLVDNDGNQYKTARFGSSGCWMTQNLRSTSNPNVNLTESSNSNNVTGLFYSKTNVTEANPDYGYLYTWDAAMGGINADETLIAAEAASKSSVSQGICPDGWVIPSDLDWSALEEEIYTNPTPYSSVSSIGTWNNYGTIEGWRTGNDNGWGQHFKSQTLIGGVAHTKQSSSLFSSGFEVLLVGSLESGFSQSSFGNTANLWSSNDLFTSIGGDGRANYRGLSQGENDMYRGQASKSSMLSVRCKLKE